jgi:hypothetical protein
MLVESISAYVAADSVLQALLGTPSTHRDKTTGIFPVQAPDEVLVPWIVYQQVSGNPLQTSTQGTGRLQTARLRFTCYGSTYKQAKTLAHALKLVMLACYGTMSTGYSEVQGSWLTLETPRTWTSCWFTSIRSRNTNLTAHYELKKMSAWRLRARRFASWFIALLYRLH